MKYLLIIWLALLPATLVAQTSYTINVTQQQHEMIQFFSNRQGDTEIQTVRQFCAAGFAPAREQYRKLIEEGRSGAIKQMTPASRAIVCAEYASVGAPCPVEEP